MSNKESPDFLRSGGEMGQLVRSVDWARTPLGPVELWPQSLRTTVSLCLSSTFPILIAWGPERVQIYNDSYRPICGDKHPQSMGQRFNECWASALPVVGHIVDRAQSGQGSYLENLRMFLDRNGYLEEAFMTFSFSPVQDESGEVGGLFHPITEVTEKMLSSRRSRVLRDLSASIRDAKSLTQIAARLADGYAEYALDLPFWQLYALNEDGSGGQLLGGAGLPNGHVPDSLWPFHQLVTHRAPIAEIDIAGRLAAWEGGPYPEPPHTAVLIPLEPLGAAVPVACLVAGVSARRALDPTYRAFYESLGSTVTSALASVRAYELEQQRAAALVEIDRAKTSFFSSVSHEFRTPLTLMLGPLEHLVATVSRVDQREELEVVQRNGLRLLKLVNTLLDFSRIEAGRIHASFEPVDLAVLTSDLASTFRSLVEKAGLFLTVDCTPLLEPLWVDREMFEKIVFNLLSNAFKFTLEGGITVALRPRDKTVELSITDTGTGIPAHELPRIFERFHRVQGAVGRSYEGSGVGLALVHELVNLHGGEIRAASRFGEGTTFAVVLPMGTAHLTEEQLQAARTIRSARTAARTYVGEAEHWSASSGNALAVTTGEQLAPSSRHQGVTGRIVVADDNADMRAYITKLLQGQFSVEALPDGLAALDAIRSEPPDLVLSDVMMPGLDGFGLLAALKGDPRTSNIPVILLSARAGEEATIEGIRAGASHYLVKPFNARELIARIEGTIMIARAQARLSEVLETVTDAFFVTDRDWRFVHTNASHERLSHRDRAEIVGRTLWEVFPDAADPASKYWNELSRCMRERLAVRFEDYYAPLDIWTDVQAYPGPEGGIAAFCRDISIEKREGQRLQREAEFQQQLVGIVSHDLRNPLNTVLIGASSLLDRDDLDAFTVRVVVRIQAATERATRLVRDLLDFTQARLGGGIAIARRSMDFHVCVENAVDEMRAAFPAREILFTRDGVDSNGQWDSDRLIQVVHNLLTNALKYGAAAAPVMISSRTNAAGATLFVHNMGEPIPDSDLPTLFEPMRRGAGRTDSVGGSVGLGLYIVQQIVRAHGGDVSVRSTSDAGTTFTVQLPS